ncbi:MAG: hypothetical protein AAGF10_05990 [Verrucomicrobiota bacterium]
MEPSSDNPETPPKKPWPMKYIALAVLAFVLCYNLYMLFTA